MNVVPLRNTDVAARRAKAVDEALILAANQQFDAARDLCAAFGISLERGGENGPAELMVQEAADDVA